MSGEWSRYHVRIGLNSMESGLYPQMGCWGSILYFCGHEQSCMSFIVLILAASLLLHIANARERRRGLNISGDIRVIWNIWIRGLEKFGGSNISWPSNQASVNLSWTNGPIQGYIWPREDCPGEGLHARILPLSMVLTFLFTCNNLLFFYLLFQSTPRVPVRTDDCFS